MRNLLAKAEATEFPSEAEAFFAKASELIGRWAIDEALIWAETDAGGRESPDERQVVVHAPYLTQKAVLISTVASAHGCRAVRVLSAPGTGREIVSIVGFPSELRWVETLVTSLLVQLTSAMLAGCPAGLSASASASWRRSFIVGFAEEVGRRLEADRATAAAHAGGERATGGGADGRRGAAPGDESAEPSVAVVLASRVEEVDEDFRRRHPHVRSSWSSGGRSHAGRAAGQRAGSEASLVATRRRRTSGHRWATGQRPGVTRRPGRSRCGR